MKKNKKLDNRELTTVSGGGLGYNKYEKETYHKACISTNWTKFFLFTDSFYLRLTEERSISISEKVANMYVDYYLSHTPEEYLEFIQRRYPKCNRLIRGVDM